MLPVAERIVCYRMTRICIMAEEYADSFSAEITSFFNEVAEKTLSPIDDEIAALQNKFDMASATNGMKKADIKTQEEKLSCTEEEIKQLCEQLKLYIASFQMRA